jgi:hypothetical protein
MTKAIIDFSVYTGPELLPVGKTVHDKMTDNAATFTTPAPPVTMAALQTFIDTFEDTLSKKSSHAIADTIAFNIARNDLEVALGDLGNYVNTVAKGDPAIVEKSGFPSFDTTRVVDTAPPAAPQDLRLRQGDLSGEIVARYKPARQHSANEVQTTVGDPNSATGWTHAGIFTNGKATLGGNAPGSTVWVRVRTAGLKGVMGAWSDPAKIMAV